MATIKSYTDISQSKKLAEFLPLESADMRYKEYTSSLDYSSKHCDVPSIGCPHSKDIPCWSLSALLGVLPKEIVYDKGLVFLEFHAWNNSFEYINNADYTLCVTKSYDNPIDACVDMIEKLHELSLL